jgi:competence protein ComEA
VRPLAKVALGLAGLVVLACIGQYSARASVHPSPNVEASLASALVPVLFDAAAPAPPTPTVVADVDASAPRAHAARATPDDPVVLNTATVDDLRRLPGVGEKRALAILELRAKLGRFRQVDDLLRVKGIGRKTLQKLRPLVRLDAQP